MKKLGAPQHLSDYGNIKIFYVFNSQIYSLYPVTSCPFLLTSLNTPVHEHEEYPSITLSWLPNNELYSQWSLQHGMKTNTGPLSLHFPKVSVAETQQSNGRIVALALQKYNQEYSEKTFNRSMENLSLSLSRQILEQFHDKGITTSFQILPYSSLLLEYLNI